MNADLLDTLRLVFSVKNDAVLAKRVRVAPPVICKMRSEAIPVSAKHMIVINEEFDMPIAEIKHLIAKGRAA